MFSRYCLKDNTRTLNYLAWYIFSLLLFIKNTTFAKLCWSLSVLVYKTFLIETYHYLNHQCLKYHTLTHHKVDVQLKRVHNWFSTGTFGLQN